MPKKFSEAQKAKWLELYENGKSEKWIANQSKCDLRTVKKGIEEAGRRRDAKLAKVELLKDALRKHQDSLMEELDIILSTLTIPPEDFAPLSWHHNGESIFTKPGATSDEKQASGVAEPIGGPSRERSTLGELLKQHLKNDRLWKVLAQWDKAYAVHLATRRDFQRKTMEIMQKVTGYKMSDQNVPKPYLRSYTAGHLFYTTVLKQAFGTAKVVDIEQDIFVNTTSGSVIYMRMTLAEVPGKEEATKRNLIKALHKLGSTIEIDLVKATHETLKEITNKAIQVVEGIKLLGIIPGQCEICRRLGM